MVARTALKFELCLSRTEYTALSTIFDFLNFEHHLVLAKVGLTFIVVGTTGPRHDCVKGDSICKVQIDFMKR